MAKPLRVELQEISIEDFPMTVEYWEAGADRHGEPTWMATIEQPGPIKIPGFGPGTWTRLTLNGGDVFIQPPPGEEDVPF